MPALSEIKVHYRRSMQPRQYETAEAEASATFVFADGENADIDGVIAGELVRIKGHVEATLGLAKENPTKPAAVKKDTPAPSAPASTPASGEKPSVPGPTATKPASPSKPSAPAKPATPPKPGAPKAAAAEGEAPKFTKGDMMKAISNTMTALQKRGVTDGNKKISKIVAAYLPDDKPPISYARIPENSWGDFIRDVEELKNGGE